MGTIWNRDLDLFRHVIEALRDEALRWSSPSDARTTRPPSVRSPTTWWSTDTSPGVVARALRRGHHPRRSGTMLGALAYGLPLLVIPQGADQYSNADQVVAAGAGRQLLRDEVTVPAIRQAVRSLLDDPDYRRAAERIAAEIRVHADGATSDRADRSASRSRVDRVRLTLVQGVSASDRGRSRRRRACAPSSPPCRRRRRSTAARSRRRSAPRSRGTPRPRRCRRRSRSACRRRRRRRRAGSSGTCPSSGAPIASARASPPPEPNSSYVVAVVAREAAHVLDHADDAQEAAPGHVGRPLGDLLGGQGRRGDDHQSVRGSIRASPIWTSPVPGGMSISR